MSSAMRTPPNCRTNSLSGTRLIFSMALLALVVASLCVPRAATATPGVDQQQTTLESDRVLAIGSDSQQMWGQIVRSGTAGFLTQIDLPIICGPSALTLQIVASGSPGGAVVSSQTISSLLPPFEWKPIVLATKPFIPADTLFGIVLSTSGSCGIGFGDGDPYPRGIGYGHYAPMEPGTWLPTPYDIGFKTYVERMCQVPGLADLTEQEARALIEAYGCAVGNIKRAYSTTVDSGLTISQAQQEGTVLSPGSAVDFVISRGLPPCKVPNVRGKKLAAARSAITRARCRVGKVTRKSSSAVRTRGRVISQRPRAGTTLPNLGKVNLVIGRGRPMT